MTHCIVLQSNRVARWQMFQSDGGQSEMSNPDIIKTKRISPDEVLPVRSPFPPLRAASSKSTSGAHIFSHLWPPTAINRLNNSSLSGTAVNLHVFPPSSTTSKLPNNSVSGDHSAAFSAGLFANAVARLRRLMLVNPIDHFSSFFSVRKTKR